MILTEFPTFPRPYELEFMRLHWDDIEYYILLYHHMTHFLLSLKFPVDYLLKVSIS